MAKLIMNPHSPARRDVPLPRTILSIGRDPSNDLVLPDAMVSRRHALIECRGSQFFLRDCNSSNGSLVNGDRVSERGLRDGDLVAIGAARLLFREELELADSGGKVVQHPSAPRLVCPSCRFEYRKGDAFCRQCGARLQELPAKVMCVSCGTAVPLPARFCNACGGRLPSETATPVVPDTGSHPKEPSVGGGELVTLPAQEPVAPPPLPDPLPESGPEHDTPQPAPPVESASAASLGRVPLGRVGTGTAPALERLVPLPPRDLRPATVPPRPRLLPQGHAAPRPTVLAGARAVATLVDGLAVGSALALVVGLTVRLLPAPSSSLSFGEAALAAGLGVLALAAGSGYQIYFWGRHGATPGQRLLGLEVRSKDGIAPIGWRGAAHRSLGWVLSAAALGLGFLPILGGGAGLHDRLAGTRVARRTRA